MLYHVTDKLAHTVLELDSYVAYFADIQNKFRRLRFSVTADFVCLTNYYIIIIIIIIIINNNSNVTHLYSLS